MISDTKMQRLYDNFLEFTDHMVGQYGAYETAGVMLAQALSIYRSSMDEDDYNKMMDSISSSRDKVQTFKGSTVQ